LSGRTETATFGAGCFWGVEETFRRVPGVKSTEVGYSGGRTENPTYEQVCSHATGHAEVVRVSYDPSEISYENLLRVFWDNHDPTTPNRQGGDVGDQYRSAVFFHTPEQEATAGRVKEELNRAARFSRPIVTEITPAGPFWRAEEYHQRYLEKRAAEASRR
jgi:peptide-methionine (S)-S-oxide reductase